MGIALAEEIFAAIIKHLYSGIMWLLDIGISKCDNFNSDGTMELT